MRTQRKAPDRETNRHLSQVIRLDKEEATVAPLCFVLTVSLLAAVRFVLVRFSHERLLRSPRM